MSNKAKQPPRPQLQGYRGPDKAPAEKEDDATARAEASEGYETKEEALKVDPDVYVPTGDEGHPVRGPDDPMEARKALYEKARKNRELVTRENAEEHPGIEAVQEAIKMAAGGGEHAGADVIKADPDADREEREAEVVEAARPADSRRQEPPAQKQGKEPAQAPQQLTTEQEPATVLVSILGKHYEVPAQDIDDAGGMEAYQKTRLANIRLQRLATEEQQFRARQAALKQPQERGEPPEEHADPPTQDGPGDADPKVLAKDLLDTVVNSKDEKDIEEWVRKNLRRPAKTAPTKPETTPTPAQAGQPEARSVAERELQEQQMLDRVAANRMMREEFPDIMADRELLAISQQRFEKLSRDSDNVGRTQKELAREAGTWARRFVTRQSGVPNETEQLRQERIVRKRKMPQPSRADTRQVQQQPQSTVSTQQRRQDYFARLRKSQGRDLAG